MLLHFWCAHQYLFKAGSPQVEVQNDSERWDFLRAWYAHMRAAQQFIALPEITACLKRSSFPFNETTTELFSNWTYSSIGNSSLGEEPRLLFNSATGLVHIPSFAFPHALRHSRRSIAPRNKVCLPLADATCWPVTAAWQADSCTLCCDPSKGPFGDPSCWRNGRSFERCCQQDFRNVMCEEIRKSTPGCLDCPQSLSYFCEEVHKFRAVKAWHYMNETYYAYLGEVKVTRELEEEVAGNSTTLSRKSEMYKSILPDFVREDSKIFAQKIFHKLDISRVTAHNSTLHWMQTEVKKPIMGNFTDTKRIKEDFSEKLRSTNSSLYDQFRKETEERARKPWLISKIFNNSDELARVSAEIEGITYHQLFAEGNATLAQLVSANKSLEAAAVELLTAELELKIIEQGLEDRESLLGIPLQLSDLWIAENVTEEARKNLSDLSSTFYTEKQKLSLVESNQKACVEKSAVEARMESDKTQLAELNLRKQTISHEIDELNYKFNNGTQILSRYLIVHSGELNQADLIPWLQLRADSWASRVTQLSASTEIAKEQLRNATSAVWATKARLGQVARETHLLGAQLTSETQTQVQVEHLLAAELTEKRKLTKYMAARRNETQTRVNAIRSQISEMQRKKYSLARQIDDLERNIVQARLVYNALADEFALTRLVPQILGLLPRATHALVVASNQFTASENRLESLRLKLNETKTTLLELTKSIAEKVRERDDRLKAAAKPFEIISKVKHKEYLQRTAQVENLKSRLKRVVRNSQISREIESLTHSAELVRSQISDEENILRVRSAELFSLELEFQSALGGSMHTRATVAAVSESVSVSEVHFSKRAQRHSLENLGFRLEKANDDMRLIMGTSERLHSDIDRQTKSLTVLAESCGRFNNDTLEKLAQRVSDITGSMEAARRQFDEWKSRRENITTAITEMRNNDPNWCDLVRRKTDLSSIIQEKLKPVHDEAVKLEQTTREAYRNAKELMRKQTERESWLRKRKSELEIEQPKLEIELSLKDELIVNITRKQVELETELKRLKPLVVDSEANFTVWNATLIALETDSKRVNATLQTYIAATGLDHNTTNPFNVLFRNYSKELNATFYQLAFAKEGLSNSTRRVAELTDEFRRAEAQYVEKQQELEEYTRKVEAGLIPRVDFKFEF